MHFTFRGPIRDAETIASGSGIREIARLRKRYGVGRWRKRIAEVQLASGIVATAEIHWYEAGNVGKKEFKIKRLL